jgi:hypothetical protein
MLESVLKGSAEAEQDFRWVMCLQQRSSDDGEGDAVSRIVLGGVC